ncbi:hypothetical protein VTN77DRAFT_8810 [Rasamsonia byssochlamydoides]|uniref:uncharacterized protein n=1 Tax=Rasamsonia byssochlamydoides TaxID=89139 RepID=UPI003742A1C6
MNERKVSAQAALDEVVAILEKSYKVFTAAERRLLETAGIDGKLREDVKMLIRGCKDITLGNVYWSYATERYLPRSCFNGNKVTIQL